MQRSDADPGMADVKLVVGWTFFFFSFLPARKDVIYVCRGEKEWLGLSLSRFPTIPPTRGVFAPGPAQPGPARLFFFFFCFCFYLFFLLTSKRSKLTLCSVVYPGGRPT